MLPDGNDQTVNSGMSDLAQMTKDALMPMAPPVLNAALSAIGGTTVDTQKLSQGGNAMRTAITSKGFTGGPEKEDSSNLGETTSAMTQFMAAGFGSNGLYMAKAIDAMMHGAKYDPDITDPRDPSQHAKRPSMDFISGLKAATSTFSTSMDRRIPDAPGMKTVGRLFGGSGADAGQTFVQNSQSEALKETRQAISSITGIYDAIPKMNGKKNPKANAAMKRGEAIEEVGGFAPRKLQDPELREMAKQASTFNRAMGKGGYGTLYAQRRSVESNYTLQAQDRAERITELTRLMNDSTTQQVNDIKKFEAQLQAKYANSENIRARLGGRALTMKNLEAIMREDIRQ